MPKLTSAQRFHNIFKRWTGGATEAERATAEKKMDEWLAKNGKTRADISSIVAEAVADDLRPIHRHRHLIRASTNPFGSILSGTRQPTWWRASSKRTIAAADFCPFEPASSPPGARS